MSRTGEQNDAETEFDRLRRLYSRQTAAQAHIAGDTHPDLGEVARAQRELAGRRLAGEPLIHVTERDGATVVEIVTDDMPYLVDSVLAAIGRTGGDVRRLVHPIVVVRRTVTGELREVLADADPAEPPAGALVESWMHLDLGPLGRTTLLEQELRQVLQDVRDVVEDTDRMVHRARALADELCVGPRTEESLAVADLLRWLADDHVTFLGYRHYTLRDGTDGQLCPELASGLGVLRRDTLATRTLAPDTSGATARDLVLFTRARAVSRVLRPAHPYYVAVRTVDEQGRLTGEHRFVGMLTVAAQQANILDIPVVARRVRHAIHRAGIPLESYSGQRMLEVLSVLPREELLGANAQTLHDIAVGVLGVAGRRVVRAFLRPDPYRRFASCLVYLPRDRYTTSSRLAMAEVLRRRLRGSEVDYSARVSEASLAFVHFTVYLDDDAREQAPLDVAELQDELTDAIRTWDDRLADELGPQATPELLAGIPGSYKAEVEPADAVEDLRRLLALEPGGHAVRLYTPAGAEPGDLAVRRFTLYLADAPVTLTAILPLLQDLGVEVLDERPAEFVRPDGRRCWLYDFGLRLDEAGRVGVGEEFCAAFRAAWAGEVESDRFSALVLRAGLSWREVVVLRAYARYACQLGSPYGAQYMAETLLACPVVARALVALFRARFDPAVGDREGVVEAAVGEVRGLIDAVAGLDADRILRGFLALVGATTRTNWFREREFVSFKVDPAAVPDMPLPRPWREVFVYSPRFEGVHLRFGPVARGGLRWSDRPQDYRTEILGLVKAQAVKNAVIVPVGAKGGFVVRAAAPGPQEVAACYRGFVGGLLEVTDNLVNGQVVGPPGVVRHDGDDAYLVVAADKGTARFSDVANEVAAGYGFWLGDAFASGGSVGYDHKAMGITARGAWESVQRHFRELGVDTQSEGFTVVGIGDMSGDVFGNGMLRSRHIRLVAAFDHRHVFVDPDPDPVAGWAERRRLFGRAGSSWDDYDRTVISAGGGVWPRTVKAVPVGPQMRAALGLAEEVRELSPPQLIRAVLAAPVDLLWNGGIGTYVKASTETHAQVGDKANDAVRIDADQLRVRVVGEGGNLGFTQRGRIEFARRGGKINTDAVDNSAGVDCSDHEVNLKILLDRRVRAGALDRPARDALLAEMTEEVAGLVLAHNRSQNAVLGVARAHAPEMVGVHARMVTDLAGRTGLDRQLEVLPDPDGFAALEAAGQGLTGPELATLLAHTKLDLTHRLIDTDLPDAPAFAARLADYFPRPVRDRFGAALTEHPLRREILTTLLVNEMVDGAGISYAFRLGEELATDPADAVRAYTVTTTVYQLPALWGATRTADIPTTLADRIILESRRLLDRASRWFLTNRPQPLATNAEITRFASTVGALRGQLSGLLCGRERTAVEAQAEAFAADGAPPQLAQEAAQLVYGYGLLDVTELTELSERDREPREAHEVAALYYALSEHLSIDLALTSVTALERGDRWHQLARLALRDDLYGSLRAITLDALRESAPGTPTAETIARWERSNASRLLRARAALHEINTAGQLDLATLSVVSRQLRGLAR
ncbi:NAD-glutamate dehydrogenase [Pseudonocardia hispaniensis]|uniref:NAD-glutamate dehydrogenase n=1 Tax=Pseudonocardia hispaniensis TaxID=904933 RepID=A0ABW1J371_9PSEU